MFWIHNLSIEYIIPGFVIIFFKKKKKKLFSLTQIKSLKKKVILCFHNIYKYVTLFIFIENENVKKVIFIFCIQI